ncbi:MAG: NAD+ synthase [Methanobacteriota archaeon]|nr:MAG: NAD+ synthase [Euryarchaeota archaeon]
MELGCERERIEQMIRSTLWESGCTGVVVGLSGGVDSAVAAALCVKALGREHVLGLAMPSALTPPEDLEDVRTFCDTTGIEHRVIPIEPILEAYFTLPGAERTPYLAGNLMARIRMTTLYYVANQERRLVCGTSNRSEYLLGYSTKHGDSAADFQPILHLYKTQVYALARALGVGGRIIEKPPSAGLWQGQTDEGEIGLSYAEIDAALAALAEHGWAAATPAEEKVLAMVKKTVHKRLAAPNLLGSSRP